MNKTKFFTTANITKLAMLSAIACVLQLIEMPMPFVPPWLKMDFSDVPAVIGAFALGPISGIFIELIKNILFVITRGTSTGGVGELANFILGASLVVPAAFVYRREHSKKGALKGMVLGIISFCIAGYILNVFMLMPFYSMVMGGEGSIIAMAMAVNPIFNSIPNIVLIGVTPFNLVKGIAVCAITMLVYKRVSPLLHAERRKQHPA